MISFKKNFYSFIITSLFLFSLLFIQNTEALSKSTLPLSGTFTIGTGGNYTTINSAVNDLVVLGVIDAVVFNILSGNYDESVTIPSITGAGLINNITFQSQTSANDVNWYSSNTLDAFTLKIDGADFLTIRGITFPDNNSSPSLRSRILFSGTNEDVKILNNVFSGGINNDHGLLSTNAQMTNLIIEGNNFDIRFGINFKEPVLVSTFTQITNNNFDCNNGMEIYNHNDMLIERNNLKCTSQFLTIPHPSCIRADACFGNLRILKNKLICVSVNSAVDGITVNYRSGPSVLVANNFISLQSGTGMWFGGCTDLNVYFNTVRTANESSGDITFVACHGTNSKNNIMVNLGNFGDASLTYYLIASTFNTSDYNNFYYTNQFILYHTQYGYITNLSQYKDSSGLDIHSIERPVTFNSNTDLHLSGASMGDEGLVGIPIAGITDDIDGQPRDPLYPYMGADESDIPLPVEMLLFISTVNRNDVTLRWITSHEINNSGFEIQKSSIIENEWSNIGFVEGRGSAGVNTIYDFTDYNVSTGKYRYRLKQIDFNGQSEYFDLMNMVYVGIPEKFSLTQNYPNPFNPSTKIDFVLPVDGNVNIKLFDISGKEIRTILSEFRNAGKYTIDVNGEELSSGIYFYTLQSGNFTATKQMMLIK